MFNAEWIFFDLGGTLSDEDSAWTDRISRTAAQNNIDPKLFSDAMITAAKNNLPEYAAAMAHFDIVKRQPWDDSRERLYSGVKLMLERLRKHYRLGIIANQSLSSRKKLERFGIIGCFDVLAISSEIGFSKPDERLFKAALCRAETSADKCIFIGDKLTNDIYPANKLGFTTIWVKQGYGGLQKITSEDFRPNFTIDKILQLEDLLKYNI